MLTSDESQNLETSMNLLKSMQNVLKNIFNLELSEGENDDLSSCFKVLVFDDHVYDIIYPFLKVKFYYIN